MSDYFYPKRIRIYRINHEKLEFQLPAEFYPFKGLKTDKDYMGVKLVTWIKDKMGIAVNEATFGVQDGFVIFSEIGRVIK